MKLTLDQRLEQILPRITSPEFLSGKGIGNEIACYNFDYSPEDELEVRRHRQWLVERIASHHASIKCLHLNLLDVVTDYLRERGLLEKAIAMQASKGDAGVLRALKGPLGAEKVRDYIAARHRPADFDLVLMSGVGSVWPMLRAHSLLNCLHTIMGTRPLVMFYPGSFDGVTLRLFGQIATAASPPGTKSYYRAFILVPGEGSK